MSNIFVAIIMLMVGCNLAMFFVLESYHKALDRYYEEFIKPEIFEGNS